MGNDITKCQGTNCPIKNSCKRFVCKESDWQSWFVDMPCEVWADWFYCEYYFNNKKV